MAVGTLRDDNYLQSVDTGASMHKHACILLSGLNDLRIYMTKHQIDKPTANFDACGVCLETNSTDRPEATWAQCDACHQWYHSKCIGIPIEDLESYASYHCSKCVETAGPSTFKRHSSRKRSKINYAALNQGDNMIFKGLHPHIDRLVEYGQDKKLKQYYELSGEELTYDFMTSTGFDKPIYVPERQQSGVDMLMPEGLTVGDVVVEVGEDEPIEVMDVLTQENVRGWTVKDWGKYFNQVEDRDSIRNVISLEISDTDLGKRIKRPKIVEQMDLVDKVWPKELLESRKSVAKYCLMSVKNSYTDFHIDFAGTQVYYKVIRGKKTFLLFPPTTKNLHYYSTWSLDKYQSTTFFPDYMKDQQTRQIGSEADHGFKIELQTGDLMLIPSGWIHAVYTPEDSLVIGGNFLTLVGMKNQLEILQIEKRTNVKPKFSFPDFQTSMWYAAAYYVNNGLKLEKNEKKGLGELYKYLQTLVDNFSGCCGDIKETKKIKNMIPKKYVGDPIELLSNLKKLI